MYPWCKCAQKLGGWLTGEDHLRIPGPFVARWFHSHLHVFVLLEGTVDRGMSAAIAP